MIFIKSKNTFRSTYTIFNSIGMNIQQNVGKILHKIMGKNLSALVRQGLVIGQNVFIGSDVILDNCPVVNFYWR